MPDPNNVFPFQLKLGIERACCFRFVALKLIHGPEQAAGLEMFRIGHNVCSLQLHSPSQ